LTVCLSASFSVTTYKPFGVPVSPSGTEKVRYAGEVQDSPTGLYYMGARYLDPELGRWLSLDPELGKLSSPQSLNRYVYCVNSPLNTVDPLGLRGIMLRGHGKWSSTGTPGTFDEFMMLWGFVPILDTVSDIYFVGKALYEGKNEEAAIYAGFASIPFVGASYYKAGKAGWNFLKRADDVPTAPGVRNADELSEQATKTFYGGKHVTITLDWDIELYRIFGGTTEMRGHWFAVVPPGNRQIAQNLYSLPSGNTGEYCVKALVPRGSVVDIGITSPLFGRSGGGVQVFVRNAELPTFFAPWRLLGSVEQI